MSGVCDPRALGRSLPLNLPHLGVIGPSCPPLPRRPLGGSVPASGNPAFPGRGPGPRGLPRERALASQVCGVQAEPAVRPNPLSNRGPGARLADPEFLRQEHGEIWRLPPQGTQSQ